MHSVLLEMSGKDRRDPTRITPYKPKEISQFEDEVDYYPLGAMLAAVAGVMMKSKLWCCVSLVLGVASIATIKKSSTDVKQIFLTMMFTLFAMFSAYVNPALVGDSQ